MENRNIQHWAMKMLTEVNSSLKVTQQSPSPLARYVVCSVLFLLFSFFLSFFSFYPQNSTFISDSAVIIGIIMASRMLILAISSISSGRQKKNQVVHC